MKIHYREYLPDTTAHEVMENEIAKYLSEGWKIEGMSSTNVGNNFLETKLLILFSKPDEIAGHPC